MQFIALDSPDFHTQRRKDLMKKYPAELRELMGNYPGTAGWALFCVAAHFTIATLLKDQPWWALLTTAWLVGAFLSHALYVFIHEATHNLIFKGSSANRMIAMICDFPLIFPGSMAFRRYHLMHHTKMGQVDFDADICSETEAKLVGNCPVRKTVWMLFLGISQALRPMKLKEKSFFDRWILLNLVVQILVVGTTVHFLGWGSVVYLLAANIFGLGLHPLGARWIAEHYVTTPGQETYSYYGPMNKVAFNVGYHIEHHDLMTIPWVNLPKLKKIAPEFYASTAHYRSYTALLVRFITDRNLHLFSRITRETEDGSLKKVAAS